MDPNLDIQETIALTKWYIEEKQLDKALLQIKPAILAENPDMEAVIIAARLYAQLQLYTHSQKLFAKYLEQDPNEFNIRFQLGMTHFDAGEGEKALGIWEAILKQVANYPPALYYSAIALLQQNQKEKALQYLKTIINTAQVDNLYYEKAKELIVQIENQSSSSSNIVSPNIYQTEH